MYDKDYQVTSNIFGCYLYSKWVRLMGRHYVIPSSVLPYKIESLKKGLEKAIIKSKVSCPSRLG